MSVAGSMPWPAEAPPVDWMKAWKVPFTGSSTTLGMPLMS